MDKRGISLVIMLLIILVMTFLIVAVVGFTQTSAFKTLIHNNRKRAFIASEAAEEFYISCIPNNDLLRYYFGSTSGYSISGHRDTVYVVGEKRLVYVDSLSSSGDQYFIWPVPFIDPYPLPGTVNGMQQFIYSFSTTGYVPNSGYKRSFQVMAAYSKPYVGTAGAFGHTMY
ncbi:hypothetical protein J7J69_05985 [candidate division WOR-3 bacterium]|nr:hypothetical protein [candidate division WOR-3 bacterium]